MPRAVANAEPPIKGGTQHDGHKAPFNSNPQQAGFTYLPSLDSVILVLKTTHSASGDRRKNT